MLSIYYDTIRDSWANQTRNRSKTKLVL